MSIVDIIDTDIPEMLDMMGDTQTHPTRGHATVSACLWCDETQSQQSWDWCGLCTV